jgi:hypothetical protein
MITISSLGPQAAAGIIGLAITVPLILALLSRFLLRVVIASKP